MDRAEELDAFKTEIDLVAFAVDALGFRLDQRSRSSARLKKDGDIIVVARSTDGHYTYFSPLDDSDNGTIVDLLQRRRNISLGEVRKELRKWLGRASEIPRASHTLSPESQELTASDRARLRARLKYLKPALDHPYLLGRSIPANVLADARFAGRIHADERGNVLFPHEDEEGLCGFEIRGPSYKGFSRGQKGLWLSNRFKGDATLVIAESAIDALSYSVLHPGLPAQYASTAGGWGPQITPLLLSALALLEEPRKAILAFDHDAQGQRYIERCVDLLAPHEIECQTDLPPRPEADWNEVLRSLICFEAIGADRV